MSRNDIGNRFHFHDYVTNDKIHLILLVQLMMFIIAWNRFLGFVFYSLIGKFKR